MIHDNPQNIKYLTIGIAHSFHQTKQSMTRQLALTGEIMHSLMAMQHWPKNINMKSNIDANNALSIWSTSFDSAARLKRGKSLCNACDDLFSRTHTGTSIKAYTSRASLDMRRRGYAFFTRVKTFHFNSTKSLILIHWDGNESWQSFESY